MAQVNFRFYAELNDHLPEEHRQMEFAGTVRDGSTIEEALRSFGVPPGEVELILVGRESAGLSRVLKDGDRVSVYPVFDSFDVAPVTRVLQRPPRRMRFVLDVHLGKLAHHLRMLGFDALYRNNFAAREILLVAEGEDRILLSKSMELTEKSGTPAAYRVRSSDPREQLIEVLRRFDLWRSADPFRRCLHCNTVLEQVEKEAVIDRLPDKVRGAYEEFNRCATCGRVYWKGSHFAKMKEFAVQVLATRDNLTP